MVGRPTATEVTGCIKTVYSDEFADKREGSIILGSFQFLNARTAAQVNPVKFWRLQRGLTTAVLSAQAGISEGYLSQIETGKRKGSIGTFKKIAKALNISTAVLL